MSIVARTPTAATACTITARRATSRRVSSFARSAPATVASASSGSAKSARASTAQRPTTRSSSPAASPGSSWNVERLSECRVDGELAFHRPRRQRKAEVDPQHLAIELRGEEADAEARALLQPDLGEIIKSVADVVKEGRAEQGREDLERTAPELEVVGDHAGAKQVVADLG